MQIQIFEYEKEQEIRTVEIDGQIWWVAKDICKILGLDNVSKALIELDQDEKRDVSGKDITESNVGNNISKLKLINEPGLYRLIFKSIKPEAKKFQKWVYHEVIPQIRKTGAYSIRGSVVPAFIRRYNLNWNRIESGYFSVISELAIRLYGRLEHVGYILKDVGIKGKEIRPDVSVGKLFASWVKENMPDKANDFKTYKHLFENGHEIDGARQYMDSLLADFNKYVDRIWLRDHAYKYLKDRDPDALEYLPKLIPDLKSARGQTEVSKKGARRTGRKN
jgi:prophage antirepressor-like protein